VPRERGSRVPEGGGCWHGKWQQPGPDCLGGGEGSPSGDGEGGVRRGEVSRKQSGVCLFEESRGVVIEGKELDPNPMPLFFSFFFLSCALY